MLDVLKWTPFFLKTEKGLFCLGGRSKIDSVLPEKGKVYLASNWLFAGGRGQNGLLMRKTAEYRKVTM